MSSVRPSKDGDFLEGGRQLLTELVKDLRQREESDLRDELYPITRSTLKSGRGLYYRPNPYFFGNGTDKRVYDQGGTFLEESRYSKKGVEEFVQQFVNTSAIFAKTIQFMSSRLAGSGFDPYIVEFYAEMLCCHLLMTDEKESITSLIDQFLDCFLRDAFTTSVRVGVDGVTLEEAEVLLVESPQARTSVRQPELADLSIPVLVKEPWTPGSDAEGIYAPSFPSFSSVIVVDVKRPIIAPVNLGMYDIRFRSRLKTVDWMLEEMRIRINEMDAILRTFQAKAAPRFPYLDLQFRGKGIASDRPLYETRMPWQSPSQQTKQFIVTSRNRPVLQLFWKTMTEKRILDRIYGTGNTSPWISFSSPTKIAFKEYHRIQSSNMDSREATSDTMLALEGLYAFKKGRKLFKAMFVDLLRLAGIRDLNDTDACLDYAWKIRSE